MNKRQQAEVQLREEVVALRHQLAALQAREADHQRLEEALRESEERYRNLFENANDAIATITLDGTITGVNRAAELLLGWSREEIIGHPAPRFTTPASMALAEERTRRFLAGEKLPSSMFEAELVRKDGSVVPVEVRTRAIRTHTGQPIGFQGIYRDITERRRAQEALQRSENRLALIFNGVSDMLALLQVEDGSHLRYLAVNAAYLRTMRLTEPQVVGKLIEEVLPPETVTLTKAKAREAMQARKPLTYEVSIDLPTGRLVVETTLSSIVDPQGNKTHLLAVGHDVTERKRAEAALQTLSRQLLDAQETERRAIARELHDELGQALQALKINLQTAWRFPKERAQRLEESIGIVDRTLQQVRNLSLDLRPSLLDDLGLVAALDWYIDRQAQRVGFMGHFTADPLEPRPSPVVETACFRVVQEALTNVSRHARARQVWVELQQHKDGLHLLIRDDGVGFDVRTAQERAAQGASLGIIGMQERVVLIGGQLEITSAPTCGTEIRAYFPLRQPLAFSVDLATDS
jgi:PAS domain S-box-containing protein